MHRIKDAIATEGRTPGPLSGDFVSRLVAFYQRQPKPDLSEIWQTLTDRYVKPLCDALAGGNAGSVKALLESLCSGELTAGILWGQTNVDQLSGDWAKSLVVAANSVGCVPLFNPEQPSPIDLDLEGVVVQIEEALGCCLTHPGVGGLLGTSINGRFIPLKLLDAVPIVASIKRLCDPKIVLELGAGLGMLSHLLSLAFDLKELHLFDLPVTSVIQATVLANSCGPDQILLRGEPLNDGQWIFVHGLEPFAGGVDLVVNQDSLPEMTPDQMKFHLDRIEAVLRPGGHFFSINQESNRGGQTRVWSAMKDRCAFKLIHRSPFWGRAGYVEEVWIKKGTA